MTYYDLNMNNKRITNIQDPSSNQDVGTKYYVDGRPTPNYYPNLKIAGRQNGIIASSFDQAGGGQLSITTLVPYFYGVYLKAGTVITNGLIYPLLAGADQRSYFGLYNKSGILLATSAEDVRGPTGFTVNNMVVYPLTSPYTVPSTDFYYICYLITSVTTAPQFAAGPASGSVPAVNYPQITQEVSTGNLSKFRSCSTSTTLSVGSTLPPNMNAYTLQGLSQQVWLGLN